MPLVGGGVSGTLSTFDAESKSAKNLISLGPGGGGSVGQTSNF